jgi:hypothetical protein
MSAAHQIFPPFLTDFQPFLNDFPTCLNGYTHQMTEAGPSAQHSTMTTNNANQSRYISIFTAKQYDEKIGSSDLV